jgi:hypothetical protein
MSNIGPLTTTFTAPSSCSFLSVELDGSPTPTSTTYYNYVGLVWPSPLDCFPSGYPNALADRFNNYYSPGICPSGWTAYPTSNYPDTAETTALCCPPGFTTIGQYPLASSFPCFTTHIASTPAPALIISGSIDINTAPYGNNPSGVLITSSDFVMEPTGWSVFGVQVRYHPADFLPHSSSTTSESTSLAPSTSSSDTQTNSQNFAQTSPTSAGTTQLSTTANITSGSSALSNGAKIGIGVGAPLVVILLAIIFAFVFIRRRRRRRRQPPLVPDADKPKPPDGYDEYKAELPGNKPGTSGGEAYAGKAELEVATKPAELEDPNTEWPLPSNYALNIAPTYTDTISPAQETMYAGSESEAVSPETSRSIVSRGGPSRSDETETEQVKYRYIDEEPKVKKESSRSQLWGLDTSDMRPYI